MASSDQTTTTDGTSDQLAHEVVTPKQLKLVVIGLMISLFLSGLDGSIVATALPTIVGELKGFTKLAWVTTAYILTSAIATLLLGKLSDLWGRRRVFLSTVALFLTGSALCGVAQSMDQLIVFRAIQGIGGGGIMALSFAILGELVPPRQRGRYMGLFTSAFALSSVTGPLAGGWIVQHINWRWIFFVNLPVGAISLLVTSSTLKLPFHRIDAKVDVIGAVLMSGSIVSLMLALEFGRDHGWTSPEILGGFAAALLLLVAFVVQEGRATEPIVPLRLFRDRVVRISCLMSLLIGTAMYGSSLYFSIYFQDVKFISPTGSGLRGLPNMAGILIGSTIIGRRISATGRYKIFPLLGLPIMCLGLGNMALGIDPSTGYGRIALAMACIGLGMGTSMPAISIAPQNAVEIRDLGITTSINTFARTLGGTIALALFGTVFNSILARELRGSLRPGDVKPGTDLSQIIRTPQQIKASPEHLREAIRHSLTAGVNRVFVLSLGFALLTFLVAFTLEERQLRTTMGHAPATIE